MKKFTYILALALAAAACGKVAPVTEEAWVNDETRRVPVLFGATGTAVPASKAINYGLVEGTTMKTLDVGVIGVAEKTVDSETVVWTPDDAETVLIDNRKVTTGEDGSITFSPAIYYPYKHQYAYTFYSYYPYSNADGAAATVTDGAYSISYTLGNTDILWANSVATDYDGLVGYNARYCRTVRKAGAENTYYPKLQYKHLLTALKFKIVGKESDIAAYDVKVTGFHITDSYSAATLCVADASNAENAGKLTGTTKGEIGFDFTDTAVTYTEQELCTVIAMPAGSYTARLDLTVDGGQEITTGPLTIGGDNASYDAGYIYTFTIKINNPEAVTIVETSVEDWKIGDNTDSEKEI